jgi:hypothetical protein
MTNFSEIEPGSKQFYIDRVNQRWGQLYHLEKEWHAKAWKYLFLSNSGGAVAMLGFLASDKVKTLGLFLKLGLSSFVLGVIVVGVCIALQYHWMAYLFREYKEDANNFLANKLSWENLLEKDNKRTTPTCWKTFWGNFWPYLSFFLFVAGSLLGGYALLSS